MYRFGKRSEMNLETCHDDLKWVLKEAIQYVDFSVVQGYRSPEVQFEYYKRGRYKTTNGEWMISDKHNIITNIDGYDKVGKHNKAPSLAVDIVPYYKGKMDWNDRERFNNIVYFIKGVAYALGFEIRLGCDWDNDFENRDHKLKDLPHLELYRYYDGAEWVKYE